MNSLKYVGGGFDATGNSGTIKDHNLATQPTIDIPKNGYIYVYCSNESQYNVFFDNLQLIHTRGQLLEETHYYPFGLTMVGISSKSIGSIESKMKYNGYVLNKDFDINFNESFYRLHDPQLGRFWQADPRPNMFESLYAAMGNNPALNYDVLGDSAGPKSGFSFSAVKLPKYEYEDYGQGKLFNLLGNANAIGSNAGINIWNGTVGLAEDATNVAFSSAGRQEVLMRYATGIYEAVMLSSGIEGKIASGAITPGSVWSSVKYLFTTPQGMEQVSTLVAGLALPGGAKTLLGKLTPELRVAVEALVGGSRERAAAKGVANGLSKTISVQKQARHLAGTAKEGGGFLNSIDDAQSVLNAIHSGEAAYLGTSKAGHQVYRFNGVTGTNVNLGAGITSQPTNVFIIKGTTSPSVVPTSPLWKP